MEYEGYDNNLSPCDICGRSFNPETLQRHRPICLKSNQKKRKVFDMSKKRAEGTELEQFKGGKHPQSRKAPAEPIPKKNNWKQKHSDFIATIRAARGVKLAMERGEPLPPPPPPTINPDYIQCDYCGRRFAEGAAQRHINFCREQHERLPNKKKPDNVAVQKQAARLQYQPPGVKARKPPMYSAEPQQDMNDGGRYSGGYGGGSANRGSGYGSGSANRGSGYGSGSANRGCANQGYSSGTRGVGQNAPVRGTRGGATYQTNDRSTRDTSDYVRADRPPSGQALRTGRTAQTYSEARQLSAKQRATMPAKKYPSSDSIHGSNYSSPQYTGTGYMSNNGGYADDMGSTNYGRGSYSRGGVSRGGAGTRGTAGGRPGGDDYNSYGNAGSSKGRGAGRGAPTTNTFAGRFCYECGAKFPTPSSKFCCECGCPKVAS